MGLGRIGFWYRLAVAIAKPPLLALTRTDWQGLEHVPAEGGVILAANHISAVDPFVLGDFVLFGVRRPPRYMAKSTLFEGTGLVARIMRGAKQIPVHRGSADASMALRDAVTALQSGEVVVIYPEGTVSRDPGKWPMRARTGVARLALLSGAPVVPVAQWGAQAIHDTYRTKGIHLLPRHTVQVQAGPAVDLSAYRGAELTAQVLQEATEDVTGESYGPLKALCEAEVQRAFGHRALINRPGLLVGPFDPTERFTYWPMRIARGGDVLAPGNLDTKVQVIDARDAARWILDFAERRVVGHSNRHRGGAAKSGSRRIARERVACALVQSARRQ